MSKDQDLGIFAKRSNPNAITPLRRVGGRVVNLIGTPVKLSDYVKLED